VKRQPSIFQNRACALCPRRADRVSTAKGNHLLLILINPPHLLHNKHTPPLILLPPPPPRPAFPRMLSLLLCLFLLPRLDRRRKSHRVSLIAIHTRSGTRVGRVRSHPRPIAGAGGIRTRSRRGRRRLEPRVRIVVLAINVDGVANKGAAAVAALDVFLLEAEELDFGLDFLEEAHCERDRRRWLEELGRIGFAIWVKQKQSRRSRGMAILWIYLLVQGV
jgi:hypothetical protein